MTRQDLHAELSKVLYIEDFMAVDTIVASVLANTTKIADPVWLALVGASSAGKSQYIRPLSEINPDKFLQIDDLTSNTLISGNGANESLIFKIKDSGIITMDDFTVLMSKNAEERNAILGQLRMIYDGRMTKASGKSKGQGITWKGHCGFIVGSTPSLYRFFAESADMGERFIMYRMKEMDEDKAVNFVINSGLSSREIDERIKVIYRDYFSSLLPKITDEPIPVDDKTKEAIVNIAKAGTHLRTPVVTDEREHFVSEFVVPEMPFRVMKQLDNIAKAFMIMNYAENGTKELPDDMRTAIEWVGYSLADDKRRAYFKALIGLEKQGLKGTVRNISAYTGLHKTAVERGMSILSAIGVVKMNEVDDTKKENQTKTWSVTDLRLREIVKRIDPPKTVDEGDYQDSDDI